MARKAPTSKKAGGSGKSWLAGKVKKAGRSEKSWVLRGEVKSKKAGSFFTSMLFAHFLCSFRTFGSSHTFWFFAYFLALFSRFCSLRTFGSFRTFLALFAFYPFTTFRSFRTFWSFANFLCPCPNFALSAVPWLLSHFSTLVLIFFALCALLALFTRF